MEKELKQIKNDEELLNNKELRDSLCSNIEVLEKVKELLLIHGTDFMTMKQVANYYEVENSVIERMLSRHEDELKQDGVCNKKYTDFLNQRSVGL